MVTKDRERLRELARKQSEIAHSPKNLKRVALWKRHNMLRGERPVIHIEINSFQHEVIDPMIRCEGGEARMLEYTLLLQFTNLELFDDDRVVPDYFPVYLDSELILFGHTVGRVQAAGDGLQIGYRLEHIVTDLHDDFEKLMQPSIIRVNREAALHVQRLAEDAFGDILPVRLCSACLRAEVTQKVVHWMGMETMFCSMYDYPDEFKEMMSRIADDFILFYRTLEREDALLPTVGFETLGQGTMCFTDELKTEKPLTSRDLWGYMDSQESVGLSPEMFREFIFPCYQRLAREFGLLSYGCCEPVSAFWDSLKTLPNLRKVSVSPWCDEAFMAEQLRGGSVIYQRKPSSNYLGVGDALDEDAFREHIEYTVKTARGCHLEITQRDVYTVHKDISQVKRYVEIIRETIDRHWQ